jgi:hypothetical protein
MRVDVLASEQTIATAATTEKYQITQLLYHTPGSHFTLPCIRHDIEYTH